MFKSIFLPLVGVALFITLVGLLYQGKLDPMFKKNSLNTSLNIVKIENLEIPVEIAKTNSERSKGLSNRDKLDEKSGMLFVFEKNSKPAFWMKNTKIALDIIWINDNKIVGIDKNVQPELDVPDSKLKRYPAPSIVDYVLEVNAGFSDKNNITIGQSLSGLEQL